MKAVQQITTLGVAIKELRKARKLSQERLAEEINIHLNTIKRIENNSSIPGADTLFKIAERLGVPVDYLYAYTKSSQYESFVRIKQLIEYENVNNFNVLAFRQYLEMITEPMYQTLLIADKQWCLYYQSICLDFVDHEPEKASKLLEEALSFTFNPQATIFSNLEARIITRLLRYKQTRDEYLPFAQKIYEWYRQGNTTFIQIETFLKLCNALIIIYVESEDWNNVYQIAFHNEKTAIIKDSCMFLINFWFAHGLALYKLGNLVSGKEKITSALQLAKCYPNKLFYVELEKDIERYEIIL
ncbi:helix-turn-helix domain-containing protein [Listeria costaricensis]|uniref:helix-turn-helix domain-containing protein n=1 Tax=Listeria costaricensis TaxID=2026604 RepID=UPI000C0803DD|nr:helix-turn-helix transcriptional regulator [Listeria costaricensis]